MKTLIIKLGASGDVIRTTTLLHMLNGQIDWITSDINAPLLNGLSMIHRVIMQSTVMRTSFDNYDLVINLEDDFESAKILKHLKYKNLFGAYLNDSEKIVYTDSSAEWFDLSLISKYGIERANKLKFQNQKSFQDIIFRGLGYNFNGEPYFLPVTPTTKLYGDICLAPKAGKVWPMKNWAFYDELANYFVNKGFIVNYLPQRSTMLEHLSDIKNHRVLISGDSLPMHFALGSGIQLVTLFICTSPAEIYDYGLMKKIVSKDLEKYWYRRDFDSSAVESIHLDEVLETTKLLLNNRTSYE